MVRIEKMYFTLKEVARRWGVRKCDIAYMVENGEMKVSTRLEGARLERGTIEVANGQSFRIPLRAGLVQRDPRSAGGATPIGSSATGGPRSYISALKSEEYAAVVEPTVSVVTSGSNTSSSGAANAIASRPSTEQAVTPSPTASGSSTTPITGTSDSDRGDGAGRGPGAGRPRAARGGAHRPAVAATASASCPRPERPRCACRTSSSRQKRLARSDRFGRTRAVPAAAQSGVNRRDAAAAHSHPSHTDPTQRPA